MGNCINACSVALHIEAPARVSIKLFKACESGDYAAACRLFSPPKEPSEEDLKEQHITDPKKWQRPHPAKADVTDLDGAQPIHVAAQFGHVDIIELLVENGAELQARDKSGWTPAHSACSANQLAVLKYLLDKTQGLAANTRTDEGVSLLHVIADKGHMELLEYLCYAKFENTNLQLLPKDVYGMYPFMYAAEQRHLDILEFLFEHIELNTQYSAKALVNYRAANGGTCLLFACANGDDAMVEYLLRSGAYPDAKTKSGASCVHILAEKGHVSTMRILINTLSLEDKLLIQQKRINKRNKLEEQQNNDGEKRAAENEEECLDLAATESQLDDEHKSIFGKRLLFPSDQYQDRRRHHASLGAKTTEGYTPLMFAAAAQQYDMVKFLVEEMMVDINTRTSSMESALFFAKKRRAPREIIELLGGEWVEPAAFVPAQPAESAVEEEKEQEAPVHVDDNNDKKNDANQATEETEQEHEPVFVEESKSDEPNAEEVQ